MTEKPAIEGINHDPLVSVIMNGYNCEEYLRQAIDSVFSQTYQNWEIIFWDNASTDATQSIATSYGSKLRYFRSETNTTLGAARNRALANVSGEYVAFLDTDDRWLPTKLMQQVHLFREDPQLDFIYSNAYIFDESTGHTNVALRKCQPVGNVFRAFLRHYPVNLQTVLIRLSALFQLDELFDPALEVSEEYDLFMRLVLGSKVGYINEPTAIYRVHGQMASLRHIGKYPVENAYILNKLRLKVNEFDILYSKEISQLEAKIGYWYAAAYMYHGKNKLAQDSLKPHIWHSPLFFVLFITSFLPYKCWNIIQDMRRFYR